MGNFTHLEPNVGDIYIGTLEVHSYWIPRGSWNSMRKTLTWCVKNVWKRLKINCKRLGILSFISYVCYVMRDQDMNYEPNPLLLDERYDEIIMEGMMYQPWNQEMKIISCDSKELEESIYDLLSHIESFNNTKL